ncbi:hypothetical protein OS125_11545 [Corynebacterium sp. P7003]|uniref:XRE family transcriptional regulator n=1 Tax=Corynebacterium pygosceleis TaxID=2800406 RepID=A0ABT3WXB4_9CORY|nr:hypothetical protein [Corynebacterium pygosceleis]MCX7445865.1 hypothetical protein [Corynebacterium pygosceleis]
MEPLAYRFRPGALETIAHQRNLSTDSQLAALLHVTTEELEQLRHGAPCSAAMAMHVSSIQGTPEYLAAWFDLITHNYAAA